MRDTYPRCKMLMDACYKFPSALTCAPAEFYCTRTQQNNFMKTGLNPYDIRRKCEGDNDLCYEEIVAIDNYANDPAIRWELGVDDEAGNYSGCSNSVGYRFALSGDGYVFSLFKS